MTHGKASTDKQSGDAKTESRQEETGGGADLALFARNRLGQAQRRRGKEGPAGTIVTNRLMENSTAWFGSLPPKIQELVEDSN
jgi:hypothetical protein